MNILHAADFHNPLAGSFIPAISRLARRRLARGDEFTFVVPRVPDASWYQKYRESGGSLVVVDDIAMARDAIAELRPDVLHLHFYGSLIPLTLAMLGKPGRVLWHVHTCEGRPPNLRNRLRSWGKYRIVGARCERILAVSGSVADEVTSVGTSRRKVLVVPNGVDVEHFRPPTAAERVAARARVGVANDAQVVAFFGRDTWAKGTDRIVRALRAVPEATLLAIGADPELLSQLPAERVVAIPRTGNVRDVYWASDAIAMPSRVEGMPYTLLEGAATGLPALGSTIAPFREALRTMPDLEVLDADDGDALAAGLRRVVRLPRADPQAVRREHSLERWVERIEDVYERAS